MNLVFTIDDNYFYPFLVTLKSIIFFNNHNNLVFHVFFKSLSKKNLRRLDKFESINVIKIQRNIFKGGLAEFSSNSGWPESSFIRLFLPYILDLDRYLYLDADVLITGDISELYNLDLKDYPISATIQNGYSEYRKKIGLNLKDDNRYFMSGALLVNPSNYRDKISLERSLLELRRLIDNGSLLPDMDTLNSIVENNFIEIDEIYHNTVNSYHEHPPLILHYAGSIKPWNYFYDGNYLDDYKKVMKTIPNFKKRFSIHAAKNYLYPKIPDIVIKFYKRIKYK